MSFSFLVNCDICTSQFSICGPKAFQVFAISVSLKKKKKIIFLQVHAQAVVQMSLLLIFLYLILTDKSNF